MSLPTGSAASLRVLGCAMILFHFASVIRAAPAAGDLIGPNPTPTDPTSCTGVYSFRVMHSNCNRFWICLNETKRGLPCPANTSFHAQTGECKPYSMVPGCTNGTGGVGYIQDHNPPIMARGNVLNIARDFLGLALEVGDPIGPYPRPTNEMPCENLDSYHVTESKCNKFWICLSQVKVGLSCPSDTSFHAQTGACKPYSMVPGCINGTSTPGSMQYHKTPIVAAEDVRKIVRKYYGRAHDKSGSESTGINKCSIMASLFRGQEMCST